MIDFKLKTDFLSLTLSMETGYNGYPAQKEVDQHFNPDINRI